MEKKLRQMQFEQAEEDTKKIIVIELYKTIKNVDGQIYGWKQRP